VLRQTSPTAAFLTTALAVVACAAAQVRPQEPATPARPTDGDDRAASAVGAPAVTADAPVVLYTDLIAGPNSGGENDQGAYLSVFGRNFGSGGLGTATRVYIGDAEVANYRYLGPSKGRADIRQITVQIGHLGNPNTGIALPVKVVVNGVSSNIDQTFTVNPGRILFVDNVRGSDLTARIGDIGHPFRHVQTPNLAGAWERVQPGDIIVMRGSGAAWTDTGFEYYFMRFRNKSGRAPNGRSGTGAIVLMSYPTEDVYIRGTVAGGQNMGCISAINGETYPGMGQWAVITGLRIDCEGHDGPVNQEIRGDHWRVVNNDLAASTAPTLGPHLPRMAGITGNGFGSVWLGNHIHDVQGSPQECHGIYIDGDGTYEIAYNLIEHIRSGNGFQTYANGTNGSATIHAVRFHHNLIHDVSKHGLNIAEGSASGFEIYDNVVYDTRLAGIRFNSEILAGARVDHNTFYNTDTSGNPLYGALTNDSDLPEGALILENNILWASPDTAYFGGTVGFRPFPGAARANLFFGGSGAIAGDGAIAADPRFADSANHDFHLASDSPALGAGTAPALPVTTDYETRKRAPESIDIGAFAR
jgi:hypothetical protein